jgi:hypothetical protein
MNNNQYNFEPLPVLKFDRKRNRVELCPCGKNNKDGKFVPYAGYEDKGYCHSCGKTFLPELPKAVQWNNSQPQTHKPKNTSPPPKPISFISNKILKDSLTGYETNHFVNYIISLFGVEVTSEVVSRYFIGTSNHYWNGATVFWQIDTAGKIRTGKIMPYNPITGKRIKEPCNCINWIHSILKQPEFALKQCLFGEHLLRDKIKPVAIVESEKTAVIASVYFPNFIWLAVGGKDGLNAEKCKVLKGRTVTLFPDLNGFELWSEKAKEFNFVVSDLLERKATKADKQQGFDIVDYLVRFNFRTFTNPEPLQTEQVFVEVNHIEQEKNELVAYLKELKQSLTINTIYYENN